MHIPDLPVGAQINGWSKPLLHMHRAMENLIRLSGSMNLDGLAQWHVASRNHAQVEAINSRYHESFTSYLYIIKEEAFCAILQSVMIAKTLV